MAFSYTITPAQTPRHTGAGGIGSMMGGRVVMFLAAVTFGSDYAAGGQAFDPVADQPNSFKSILAVIPVGLSTSRFTINYLTATKKLMLVKAGSGSAAPADVGTSDQSGESGVVLVIARTP